MAKVMAWGETREQSIRTLQRALLELRLEGVVNNVPLLRSILASKEFTDAVHHTGSVPHWVNELRQRHMAHQSGLPVHPHHGGSRNGHDRPEKEVAAAIGVAMAMALQQRSQSAAPSTWRTQRRREQLYSGSMGSRGWR